MLRLIFSALTTLVLIYFMLRMMLYYVHANIHAEEYYGKDSYWKYYPSVVYSLLPVVSPLVFEPIAQYLNDFEMHTTKVLLYLFLMRLIW